jgi:hypothetical protein
MVRLVLESVGLPTEAPRVARARDPTELFASLDLDLLDDRWRDDVPLGAEHRFGLGAVKADRACQ